MQILFKLINPYSKHYFTALKWLQCETLTENELKELGVGKSLSDEMRASGALKSILQISDRVVVFGFDQIEGVLQRFGLDGLKTFLQTLVVIYNGIPNHISLISCQSQIWINFVIQNLDKSMIQQMISNNIEPIDCFIIDWKGTNSADKQHLLPLLEEFDIPIKKTKDF